MSNFVSTDILEIDWQAIGPEPRAGAVWISPRVLQEVLGKGPLPSADRLWSCFEALIQSHAERYYADAKVLGYYFDALRIAWHVVFLSQACDPVPDNLTVPSVFLKISDTVIAYCRMRCTP